MRQLLRFFWNATRGHRLAPWRSPYLCWRMETYSGLKMDKIGFVDFWRFMLRERKQLRHFLKWTSEMQHYARPKPKHPQLPAIGSSISIHQCPFSQIRR